jgi:hypothetical protein
MSNIIMPEESSSEEQNEKELQINYTPTEEDEEKFFLMYHMNLQPSEVDNLDPERRKWIMARFMAQKSMEREAMERHRLMAQIGPSITGSR